MSVQDLAARRQRLTEEIRIYEFDATGHEPVGQFGTAAKMVIPAKLLVKLTRVQEGDSPFEPWAVDAWHSAIVGKVQLASGLAGKVDKDIRHVFFPAWARDLVWALQSELNGEKAS